MVWAAEKEELRENRCAHYVIEITARKGITRRLFVSPIEFLEKIIALIIKLNNPSYFWYSLHHYLKKDVTKLTAERIYNRNKKSFTIEDRDFIIPTYDGSNQCVHPDMVFYDDIYWLVVTPYPYGMEEYENPCLYYGHSIESLIEFHWNPIERQRKHEIGFHLSDACIFDYLGSLICAYRENTREDGVETSYIYIKTINDDNSGKPILLMQSKNDPLLSPAFYVVDKSIHVVHVNRQGSDSELIHSVIDDTYSITLSETEKCLGIPQDFYLWHIGIDFGRGRKSCNSQERLRGLFLLRSKNDSSVYKLVLAYKEKDSVWHIKGEIKPGPLIVSNELHPYKSCFIPNTNQVLYSYIDKKHRYRLTRVNVM